MAAIKRDFVSFISALLHKREIERKRGGKRKRKKDMSLIAVISFREEKRKKDNTRNVFMI